jgi:eukaryotic-like serine/threonine-protein kinase
MPEPQGTTIGKYQIIELVGEGSMGSVYRGFDPVLNRSVAIKVMSASIARDDALRNRFLREAQSAGSLQHPNVVTIYDFGEVEGHLYIAMEFVSGVDLERLLVGHESLSLDRKLDIMIDVLAGLDYAHQHGIIHRDIKPANIRVTNQEHAKIMDFGVAHLESSNMTKTGVMMGTPNYMAPEQITGAPMSPATDIFSAGAVLYQLLTNAKPFTGDTLHQVLYKVVSEDPIPVTLARPGLPSRLDAIITKALQKDPRARYQSAIEMGNDLTAVRAALSSGSHSKSISLSATLSTQVASPRSSWDKPTGALASSPGGRIALFAGGALLVAILGLVVWSTVRQPAGATVALRDSTPVAAAPVVPPPKTDTTPTRDVVAPELLKTLQASATRARARAVAAGATDAQLASGDRQFAEAVRAIERNATSEAVSLLNDATASWLVSERTARETPKKGPPQPSIAANAPTARGDSDSARVIVPPIRPTTTIENTPPVSAPLPPTPQPRAAEPPARSAESEIRRVVADYARAISARDLAMIRAVYPAVTAAQQRGFQDFFGSVRSLHADLAADSIDTSGDAAEAKISGAYTFTTASGRNERQPVSFRATLKRENGTWKLAAVR